ncbi:MAG: branched-chain amino acid ABC transporter permease, partial [Dehalococcoidia bacterium]|nr:branched-chain amino acid ABC transporter permease [Dehalococcoidia bacterium]
TILIRILLYTTLATGWNLIGGFGGQISLGHAAFLGAGAYTLAFLSKQWDVPLWMGLGAGGVVATILSLGVGALCFRLRGPYFMLVTLAMAEMLREIATNWKPITNGASGLTVKPLFTDSGNAPYYWLALALASAAVTVTYLITRSKMGYQLVAMREDEDAAESIGIDTARLKLQTLAISACFVGIAGAFYGSYVAFIGPDSVLGVNSSIEMIVVSIVGGAGTIPGPILGAVVLGGLYEFFRLTFKEAYLVVYGASLAAVVFFIPGGLAGEAGRLWRYLMRRRRRSGNVAS